MRIERYKAEYADVWNRFVDGSKNGTFLFNRGYMDYHSDRFKDHSLMFYDNRNKLAAVLPANESGQTYYSHQGLTYGGYVLSPRIHGKEVLDIFELTLNYLREQGFNEFYYRQIPYPYHLIPSQEEEYALWKNNAKTVACGLSSCISLYRSLAGQCDVYRREIRYEHRYLIRKGYTLAFSADIRLFWDILETNLRRHHDVSPVHNIREMMMLRERFPDNIDCCLAYNAGGEIEAGAILYLTNNVVHIQYMSASERGRETRAGDFLVEELVEHYSKIGDYKYVDFGISTEHDGTILNEGLLNFKERLGGRGIVYKTWRINI